MFATILYGFGMILLELTRTDVVFSGTSELGFFTRVLAFIRIFGVGLTLRRCLRGPQALRVPPRACLGGLWLPREASGPSSILRGSLLVHKKSP